MRQSRMRFTRISQIYWIFLYLLTLAFPAKAGLNNPERPPPPQNISYDCQQQVAPHIKIDQWFFGMRNKRREGGGYEYIPAKTIPFKVNQDVGFKLWISSQKPNIHWKYEYELPVPLPNWDQIVKDPIVKFSPDKKMAILEDRIHSSNGVMEEFWFFLPGDPLGMYRMTVYLDGYRACEFLFNVQ